MEVFKTVVRIIVFIVLWVLSIVLAGLLLLVVMFVGVLLLWGGLRLGGLQHLLGNTSKEIVENAITCIVGVLVVAALQGTGIWNLAVAYYSKEALEKRKLGRISSEKKWQRLFNQGEITPQKWLQWMEENEGGGTTQDEEMVEYEIRKRKQEAKQLKREAKQRKRESKQ
jgi:hypothetical protein